MMRMFVAMIEKGGRRAEGKTHAQSALVGSHLVRNIASIIAVAFIAGFAFDSSAHATNTGPRDRRQVRLGWGPGALGSK